MDYKEQLKEALSDVNTPYIITAWIEKNFPELVESEDEQIRKGIIELVKQSSEVLDKQNQNNMIAWLEKQGSVKEIVERCKNSWYNEGKIAGMAEGLTNDEKYQQGWHDALEKQGKPFDENIITRDDEILQAISVGLTDAVESFGWSDFGGLPIEEIQDWLEKQGEKTVIGNGSNSASVSDGDTSVTNAEVVSYPTTSTTFKPKFKVGDFIVNDYCMGRVVELTNDAYLLDTEQGIPFSYEHNAHLWSIKDAEDGDVLCCESGWTCIFKALNSAISFSSYCFMDNTGWFCETGSESHTLEKAFIKAYNGNIYPATKEQRDLLFTKMHEAGYEWDAEKKELKLLITNGGDFCQENCKGFQETGKCFADGDCEAKINAEKKELKKCVIDEGKSEMDYCFTKMMNGEKVSSVWGEEDEDTLNETIQHLKELIRIDKAKHLGCDVQYYQRDIAWLKSLKERIK